MDPTSEIGRITVKSVLAEAWHSLTHVEKGLRKTILALATTPGKMLRSYLEGDRKPYQKPFSFLLIATALFALVLGYFHKYYLISGPVSFGERLRNNEISLEKYYSWFHIVLLPAYGFVCFLLFKRLKYNYAEWLVICCYAISFVLLLQIPFHFLLTYFHFSEALHKGIQLIISEMYTVYALNAFLRDKMGLIRIPLILLGVVINFSIFLGVLRGIAYLITV